MDNITIYVNRKRIMELLRNCGKSTFSLDDIAEVLTQVSLEDMLIERESTSNYKKTLYKVVDGATWIYSGH